MGSWRDCPAPSVWSHGPAIQSQVTDCSPISREDLTTSHMPRTVCVHTQTTTVREGCSNLLTQPWPQLEAPFSQGRWYWPAQQAAAEIGYIWWGMGREGYSPHRGEKASHCTQENSWLFLTQSTFTPFDALEGEKTLQGEKHPNPESRHSLCSSSTWKPSVL